MTCVKIMLYLYVGKHILPITHTINETICFFLLIPVVVLTFLQLFDKITPSNDVGDGFIIMHTFVVLRYFDVDDWDMLVLYFATLT